MAKKIKKVETPIDQRETLVSIQKNFADSELSVEEKLKTLYALQKADSEIDKILQLRGELPVEVENLENEVLGLKARAAQINTEIDTLNSNITDYKHQIVECDTAIEKYKNQMDSVTNSRQCAERIHHCGRWRLLIGGKIHIPSGKPGGYILRKAELFLQT